MPRNGHEHDPMSSGDYGFAYAVVVGSLICTDQSWYDLQCMTHNGGFSPVCHWPRENT